MPFSETFTCIDSPLAFPNASLCGNNSEKIKEIWLLELRENSCRKSKQQLTSYSTLSIIFGQFSLFLRSKCDLVLGKIGFQLIA